MRGKVIRGCAIGAVLSILGAGATVWGQTAASAGPAPAVHPAAARTAPVPAASAVPVSPRQAQALADADQLLALAQQLKVEVDKTNRYMLSLKAIRKAEDIEKLAKNLQQQIRRE